VTGILCIDIGGSRIKATVLPERVDIAGLPPAPQVAVRSLGWLNESLPEIIDRRNWASVVKQEALDGDYDRIAICVPGPVNDGQFLRPDLNVPQDLLERFSKVADKPVVKLVKDADAWTVGAVTYLDLCGDRTAFPMVALAFGTGVALSIAADEFRVISTELSQWGHRFRRLESAAGRPITQPWEVHSILGMAFFDWVGQNKRHWSYQRIRDEFTNRVIGLLEDIIPVIDQGSGLTRTVWVGGGNVEFASIRAIEQSCRPQVKSLWSRRVSVNPDLIPLLGLHRLVTDSRVSITSSRF
jgi:hypothetical protein